MQGEIDDFDPLFEGLEGLDNGGIPEGETPEQKQIRETAEAAAELSKKELKGNAAVGSDDDNVFDTTTLTDDDKTALFEVAGGVDFDDAGNVVNDKGEIVLSVDDVKAVLDAAPEELSLVDKAVQLSGLELKDDKGELLKFENSEKGVIELAKQLGKVYSKKETDGLFKTYPVVEDFVKHLVIGKKPEEFFNGEQNYSNIVLTDDTDRNTYLSLIKDKYKKVNNMSDVEAAKLAAFHDTSETWKEEGKEALTALTTLDRNNKEAKEKQYNEVLAARKQANEEYWNTRKQTIDKGVLINNIQIPVKDREDFFKYLAVPVDANGKSQAMIDASTAPVESELFYQYLRFKKADFKSLIQSESANAKVNLIKERLAKRNIDVKQSMATRLKKVTASSAKDFPNLNTIHGLD